LNIRKDSGRNNWNIAFLKLINETGAVLATILFEELNVL
jgi:hypothetical protein